jgi:two-component system response regulator YesN
MLKVLIVDDEFLARIGLMTFIDWNQHGFEIIGEAENGQQALEFALVNHPDIIISDIQMPILNGIELIQAASEQGLKSKFVMLSSYDDFDLVKGALKAGAEDYVLKLQMEEESLLAVLAAVKRKIELQRDESKSHNEQKEAYNRDLDVLRQVLVRDLFNGKVLSAHDIQIKFNQYQLSFYANSFVCISFRLIPNNRIDGKHEETFKQLLKRNIKQLSSCQLIECEEGYFIGLCSFETSHSTAAIDLTVSRLCKAIIAGTRDTLNLGMLVGVSTIHHGEDFLRQSYLEAMYAITQCSSDSTHSIAYYHDSVNENEVPWLKSLDKHIAVVAAGLEDNDVLQIEQGFSALIGSLEHSATLPTELVMGNSYVLNYLVQDFVQRHNLEETLQWAEIKQSWNDGSRTKGLHQYISWIGLLKEMVCQIIEQESDSHSIILRAKRYVHEHIAEPISLAEISNNLGLSSSYFSRLFSQENEQCFVDYVRQKKIEHAQALIRTSNKKMYEIAALTGYENVHYFSRVFKKTVGISPMEYRHGKR